MVSRRSLELALRFAAATAVVIFIISFAEYGRVAFLEMTMNLLHIRGFAHAAFYLAGYRASVAGLVVLANLSSKIASMLSLFLLFVRLIVHDFTMRTFSEPISQEHLNAAVTGVLSAKDFISSNLTNILLSAVTSFAAILIAVVLVRHLIHTRFGWRAGTIPLAGAALACSTIWWTQDRLAGFPSPYRTVTRIAMFATQPQLFNGERAEVPYGIEASQGADADVIILLVDESVGSEFLGINGASRNTTPYLSSISDQYVNLGRASSGANHSVASNMIFQGMLRADQLPDMEQRSLREANIFRYAQRAGYHTAYIDAQSDPRGYINYMRSADAQTIDTWYRVNDHNPDINVHERDNHTIGVIRGLIKENKKLFVYVLKQGAHAPFEPYYPLEERIFTPTMPSNSLVSSSTQEVHNSYANAIRWGVDKFFENLLPTIDWSRTTVIYTSDHGQSVEDGGRGVGTHGKVTSPPITQASVPLLVFGKTAEARLRIHSNNIREKASHFQIVPSLLIAMGYPEDQVVPRFGLPLWRPLIGPRLFLSGDLYGRGRAHLNTFD